MKESGSTFFKGRLRRLSPEEINLWLAVTKSVAPLPGARSPPPAAPERPAGPPGKSEPCVGKPKANGEAGSRILPGPSPAARPAAPALAPLERRLRQKLARGRAGPDAAIDLHGLRSHEAHGALYQFLVRAQLDGAKLVLVVTGKGERDGAGERAPGVLRRSVPQWLRGAEYHSIVVGFEEASRPHGGAGALYVRLRRRDRVKRERPGE
ncbi:Smr/MutS family protein [Methylocapsa palsarum]|uniref:DNA-nicking endonuclease, Smr domain n=1 Tax=Methylocapsa palsarum TaxID=1612308 RepID=A0A1I3Z2T5_9HYPH|nr:Smr/MutS family protein [Methylocapsa palsarum]SFK38355.1 DNA-nicking endonuclease, Smr domain [Methylocapsa palsarum]